MEFVGKVIVQISSNPSIKQMKHKGLLYQKGYAYYTVSRNT
jgi:hypothetical protein